MKEFIQSLYKKDNFLKRLILVIIAVITMGFAISWLVLVDMGTDPYTLMNLTISQKLNIPLGHWQAGLNIFLFIFVIIFGKNQIGFGTLANMFLVGYSIEFFSWLWEQLGINVYFASATVRYIVFAPALLVFLVAAAVYMDVELGTSPYDALAFIIASRISFVPFKLTRICYDLLFVAVSWVLGGRVQIVTILMALLLGPIIQKIGQLLQPVLNKK